MNGDFGNRSFGPPRVVILRFDWSRLGNRTESTPTDTTTGEAFDIVDGMMSIVRDFRTSARRVGTPIDGAPLRGVIRALRIESLGEDPGDLLRSADPVETFLRESLFRELLEESVNVLSPRATAESPERRRAKAAAVWREALGLLESRLGLR